MKFAIFLKSSLLFQFLLSFLIGDRSLRLGGFGAGVAMGAEISVFDICVEAIIYLLLYNMHDSTGDFYTELLLVII